MTPPGDAAEVGRVVAALERGIGYRWTPDERLAAMRQPPALPPEIVEARDTVHAALEGRVPPFGVVSVSLALDGDVLDAQGVATWLPRYTPDFERYACLLIACGVVPLDDARALVDSGSALDTSVVRAELVLALGSSGRLDEARQVAESMDADAGAGYRRLALCWARRGDADAFFGAWSRYDAGRNRQPMAELKRELVTGVARAAGWRAAYDLATRERRLAGFESWAIRVMPESHTAAELVDAFAGSAVPVPESDQLDALVAAILRESPKDPEAEHPLLGVVLDRIIAVDPAAAGTIDKQVVRWRDGLLLHVWPALADAETLRRVRAAVRTPSIKRELSVLARDIPLRKAPPR